MRGPPFGSGPIPGLIPWGLRYLTESLNTGILLRGHTVGGSNWVVRNFISPAVTTLAILGASSVYERLSQGGFAIPAWGFWVAVIGGVLVFLLKLPWQSWVGRDESPGIAVTSIPMGPWVKVGRLVHAGVEWTLRAPEKPVTRRINPDRIEADRTPLCPQCSTELEEKKRRFRGYLWECVKCGFSKKNKESFSVESERASKIGRSEFKNQNSDENPRDP